MEGTVKKLVIDKGFGFILGSDGKEYFFHYSGLKNVKIDELEEGRDVIFEETEGKKGLRAEDIFI